MTLSFDPDRFALPHGHFIGGRLLPAEGTLKLVRPSDAAPYADRPVAGEYVVDQAVASAKQALKDSGWAGLRPRERTRAMHRWADPIEAEAETLARLEAVASGTVWVNRYGRPRGHILPTGGHKRSGIGKDLGREAYLANRQAKSALIKL